MHSLFEFFAVFSAFCALGLQQSMPKAWWPMLLQASSHLWRTWPRRSKRKRATGLIYTLTPQELHTAVLGRCCCASAHHNLGPNSSLSSQGLTQRGTTLPLCCDDRWDCRQKPWRSGTAKCRGLKTNAAQLSKHCHL